MSFSFSDEQAQFRDILRRFLAAKSPPTEVRRLMETEAGYDPAVWRQLCDELGVAGLHLPEDYGGQGFGLAELGIVMEEMGRALLCSPFFGSSVLAGRAILHAGNDAQRRLLLPDIAAGRCIASLALAEVEGRWDPAAVRATATLHADGHVLNGRKSFVLDGLSADLLVVAARAPGSSGTDGVALFTVRADAAGMKRRALEVLDPTRKLAEVTLEDVPAALLGDGEGAVAAIERTLDEALTALASESAGGAQALFDSALAYVKMRMQFGRAIGSFQAIKHRLADMLLELELAKSAAYQAASAADDEDPEFPALASAAKAAVADAYVALASATVQLHGGIGFTWENDTHLWFKRAKSAEVFLGDPDFHRERFLQLGGA